MTLTEQVYNLVATVPRGKVTTYGDIGKKLGTKAYRGIGQILHRNPTWPAVPCHRVVMKDGSLAPNYGMGGPSVHRTRLEAEGVTFIGEKVVLSKHRATL
ncbi:MGMT family protein [Candidatus Woesebacteria bacterium]|nr:MGMT family protein [Candidatus Woesebacteria bacterium]